MVPQIHRAGNITFYNANRNWRLGLLPRSPRAGVATGL